MRYKPHLMAHTTNALSVGAWREIQLLVHVLPPRTQIIPDNGSPSNHQHMAKDCLTPLLLEILTAGLQF